MNKKEHLLIPQNQIIEYGKMIRAVICSNCQSYTFEHPNNMVFHGFNSRYFFNSVDTVKKPVIDIPPHAPNYFKYLSQRYISVGPLNIAGLTSRQNDLICGFSTETLQKVYPAMRFMNYQCWEEVGFHDFEGDIEIARKSLFFDSYHTDFPTEILLEELDISLASIVLLKIPTMKKSFEKKIGKSLDCVVVTNMKELRNNWLSGLKIESKCPCKF